MRNNRLDLKSLKGKVVMLRWLDASMVTHAHPSLRWEKELHFRESIGEVVYVGSADGADFVVLRQGRALSSGEGSFRKMPVDQYFIIPVSFGCQIVVYEPKEEIEGFKEELKRLPRIAK